MPTLRQKELTLFTFMFKVLTVPFCLFVLPIVTLSIIIILTIIFLLRMLHEQIGICKYFILCCFLLKDATYTELYSAATYPWRCQKCASRSFDGIQLHFYWKTKYCTLFVIILLARFRFNNNQKRL